MCMGFPNRFGWINPFYPRADDAIDTTAVRSALGTSSRNAVEPKPKETAPEGRAPSLPTTDSMKPNSAIHYVTFWKM